VAYSFRCGVVENIFKRFRLGENNMSSESVEMHLARAHAHRENREIDKAIPEINKALRLDPNNAHAKKFLELALKMQAAKNELFGNK
jgi:tetratricopeptide (TPR) repeat protein